MILTPIWQRLSVEHDRLSRIVYEAAKLRAKGQAVMRILFLTNFYPPHHRGGMELSCQSVVTQLQNRGHATSVLTSNFGCSGPGAERGVARRLYLEMDLASRTNGIDFFLRRRRRRKHNRQILLKHVRSFEPDVVFVWGMWNLHRVLARDAEALMNDRVLYRFADYWPSLPPQYVHYWREPGRHNVLFRSIKAVLRPIALSTLRREQTPGLTLAHSYCVSHAVKDELIKRGVPIPEAEIIHNGIDLDSFSDITLSSDGYDKLLYIGRLSPEKGVRVLIEALSRLASRHPGSGWSLSIVGDDESAETLTMKNFVRQEGLSNRVHFQGHVPHEEIPALLREHGVLVVPSLWQEPFSRVVLEGMAAGSVVVASATGGNPEMIEDGRTGRLFEPGNVHQLVETLERLVQDPLLSRRLSHEAREAAFERFSLDGMVDRVEALLQKVAAQPYRS